MGALPIGRANQFGTLAEPGGRLVADAGANALLRVAANGTLETVAVFPPPPNLTPVGPPTVEAGPTDVARGSGRRPVCRPGDGLPVRPGGGQCLSGGSGTESCNPLPRDQ